MPAGNTTQTYGAVAKSFHWLTALLIIALIPLGVVANDLPYDTPEELQRKAFLFSIHKTLGVAVFFVALARILWAIAQPKPGPLHPDRKAEHWAAETVHWLLYGSLVIVPLSGWIHHAATQGFAPIWWPLGQNLPLVPKSEAIAGITAGLHNVFTKVLAASLLLHIAGALKHHFRDRDATLRRMWFGRTTAPNVARHRVESLPVVSALAVWCVAIGIGGWLGLYASHAAVAPQTELETVASDWVVEEGEIAIEVVQMGSAVRGQFADWTADIAFDPDVSEGKAGSVAVVVSIGSLTLGSVTEQAMGADFFDVESHPTATYTADIMTTPEGGHIAEGTLTIKEQSVPVNLPFTLALEDGVARMESAATVNRLDFGIGQSMNDEGSLGFSVAISVAVTARQAEE